MRGFCKGCDEPFDLIRKSEEAGDVARLEDYQVPAHGSGRKVLCAGATSSPERFMLEPPGHPREVR